MSDFKLAVEKVLKHEGGYTPGLVGDAGGETNFGISKRAYPSVDIKALTREQAIDIYRKDYWNPLYDRIESQELANSLFDMGVNAGVRRAVKMLQRVLVELSGTPITVDGVFGLQTLEDVNMASPVKLLTEYTEARLAYYQSLGKPQFMRSWTNRAVDTSPNPPTPIEGTDI